MPIEKDQKNLPDNSLIPRDAAITSALRTIAAERDGLSELMRAIAGTLGKTFTAAVQQISRAEGRVILTGMGKSGQISRKIASTLSSTGTPSYYVHPAEASHGDLGMVQPEDIILALSWSGETGELADIISYAKRHRVPIAAMTANSDSTLGRQADICLTLPRASEACPNGLAPTTSTVIQLACGDALAVALLEARGFSAHDFSVYHPGGRLGASLRRVREIMHSGAQLPIVRLGTSLREAVIEIDDKGLGSVIVVDAKGRLSGIITDGDLRRNMFRVDLNAVSVDAIMSRNPRTLTPDTIIAEAVLAQESKKITALIVVEEDCPIGIVHYHDLLRSRAT